MSTTTVFTNNRSQAIRLPTELRLPENVRRVSVRAVGCERIIAPLNRTWDSFFLEGPQFPDDFMPSRAGQQQVEREAF